jgi:hypothetical protein
VIGLLSPILIFLIFLQETFNTKKMKVLIALDYDPTATKVAETGYSFASALGAETIPILIVPTHKQE